MNLLGIDIGGTKIAGGLVDMDAGRVLLRSRVPTEAEDGGPVVLRRALDLARSLVSQAREQGLGEPLAVGVGAGGQIDPVQGVVVSATDVLPGWAGTPLRQAFEDGLNLPTSVDNDVNALAVGEQRFGAGRGHNDLLYLALGTGVGGAIISGGRLHRGAHGSGGELGHLVLFPDGLPCTCGGRGCLEQYANGAAYARYRQEEGDDEARAAYRLGEMLGLGLVSLANLFDPDRIIIGGGLADLGESLLEPARRVLRERALPGGRDCPVLPAALGPDASVIGAATLGCPHPRPLSPAPGSAGGRGVPAAGSTSASRQDAVKLVSGTPLPPAKPGAGERGRG